MKRFSLGSALVVSGLLMAAPGFAQSGTAGNASDRGANPSGAQKQHTQSDPTGQYNFSTPGGSYSARPSVTKQRTDGEDVTGNNNFAPASK